jgi:dolichol kinase
MSSPKCFNWLVVFLLDYENTKSACMPRVAWIIYWFAVLGDMVPITAHPKFATLAPAIVLRKWFHLVAILLFTPTTFLAPQLMALSYAIALCTLMFLECIRPQLPRSVRNFYLGFLDTDKDNPNCVCVSYLMLIGGCAFPLWLSICIGEERRLLKLWGVLALGIGDSFGAIVGSFWGRTKWGRGRKRSLEGSLAMLCGLGISCSFLGKHWFVLAVYAT